MLLTTAEPVALCGFPNKEYEKFVGQVREEYPSRVCVSKRLTLVQWLTLVFATQERKQARKKVKNPALAPVLNYRALRHGSLQVRKTYLLVLPLPGWLARGCRQSHEQSLVDCFQSTHELSFFSWVSNKQLNHWTKKEGERKNGPAVVAVDCAHLPQLWLRGRKKVKGNTKLRKDRTSPEDINGHLSSGDLQSLPPPGPKNSYVY